MKPKTSIHLFLALLCISSPLHLRGSQSNTSTTHKQLTISTLALMFLNNKSDTLAKMLQSKDTVELKPGIYSRRAGANPGFVSIKVIPDDILTLKKGDKIMLTTGRVAEVTTIFPPKENNVRFSYKVKLRNNHSIQGLYDEHLAGLRSKLARGEYELALGDVVLVKDYGKMVIPNLSENDLQPLAIKEITVNPESCEKANPIGKVAYLDGDWVGLIQVYEPLPSFPNKKTNSKHTDEKVDDGALDKQQPNTNEPQPPQSRWIVPRTDIACILDREHRYKVYDVYNKYGKPFGSKKHSLGLRYPPAAGRPMGSVMYQASTSKFMRIAGYFMDGFTHKVLLQGKNTHIVDIEKELLLPAGADGFLPSPPQALASGSLILYNKPNTNTAWTSYTYTLCSSSKKKKHKAVLLLCNPNTSHVILAYRFSINSATKPLFWCDKKTMPCRYGLTLTQPSQQLVFSFANEKERRVFYHALAWLTSPYVLAIEEVNDLPTGHTRLLACADIKQMTLQQLANHMQSQWTLREGTLHQNINFLDPHFTFERHQQQSLSTYYNWPPKQRYKKVQISLYRTSKLDCIERLSGDSQFNNQSKQSNICPFVARRMGLKDEKDVVLGKLHPEDCQDLCPYVDYLFGQNNNYTFELVKQHMTNHYHGKITPCSKQPKCPYNKSTNHQAQCHCVLYSHVPTRTHAPQTLPSDYSPFKSQEDPEKARQSQYQPSQFEAQDWDSTYGYLQPFMHEQITNGYLFRWAGKTEKDFSPYEMRYKRRLGYSKNDPNTLTLSFDCLPTLGTIKSLFFSKRHQRMGAPLTLAELAAMYVYTLDNGPYQDFNNTLRKGDYHKWRWMDGLLHKGITKLSFLEDGHYPLYTGFKKIRLNKTRQTDQRWSDYTSSSCYPAVAQRFHGTKGMQITIDSSMLQSAHVPCCGVSWLSLFPQEGEVLFARGTSGHTQSTIIGIDSWEVKVTGWANQLQQVSVRYNAALQQIANHPLPMMHQLFGRSQMFTFTPATYHQLVHKLLSGQPIAINQMLGVEKDRALLYIAAQNGHTDVVKILLIHDDIKINLQTNAGESPLYIAARNGHKDVVRLLVTHDGIKINLHDQEGRYPFWIATYYGHTDVVRVLLQHKDINVSLKQNTTGAPPLYIAAQNGHADIVRLLLQNKDINVNLQAANKASALYIAAQNGHTDVIKLLLSYPNTNVNLRINNGTSALFMAAQNGHTDVVRLLLQHKDINVNLQHNTGAFALWIATRNRHTTSVKLLVSHPKIKVNLRNFQGIFPLWMASEDGHIGIIKCLLKHPKINVNLQDKYGYSALGVAAQNERTDIVRLLLERKDINVNLQNNQGISALWIATKNGHTDIVRLLLQHKDIKVNLEDNTGASALLVAVAYCHTAVVRLLLTQPGIQVNLATQTNSKVTPLDIVYMKMQATQDPAIWDKYHTIWQILKQHGAKLVSFANSYPQPPQRPSNHQPRNLEMKTDDKTSLLLIASAQGQTDIVERLLKDSKINVNLQHKNGIFALYMAAQNGHTDIVNLLLQHKNINVNLQTDTGTSAFYMAAQNGHKDIVRLLLQNKDINVNLQRDTGTSALYIVAQEGLTDIVRLLLHNKDIKVNLQAANKASALYIAAQNGQTEVVRLLLEHKNINVNLQHENGISALYMAAQNGHIEVVKLLLSHPKIKVNLQDQQGRSPLLRASASCHIDIVRLLLAQSGIQVNLATQTNPKVTPLDVVYGQMKLTQDPAIWDKYYAIWHLLKKHGAKLIAYAHEWPQPPQRPSNQQGFNLDMQALLSLFQKP